MELPISFLSDSSRPAPSPERAEGTDLGDIDLDEELVLLATQEDGDTGQSEGPTEEPGLLSVIRQKDKDLVLAARLGKALLERNQDMTRRYEEMQRELTERLEHLEQEKHELKRRFENREGEWEGRVSELESDVKQLQEELEKQQVCLREADREKSTAVQELSEQNQKLLEQLNTATEMERQLSLQVNILQEEFREKNQSTTQHISRLESLLAEIKMLSDRKRELEEKLSTILEENEHLQGLVEDLQDREIILSRQSCAKELQLGESQLELEELKHSYRQLQVKMEELRDEKSLQHLNSTSTSLLSEIEQSIEAEEQEQEREQLRLQLWEAHCQVRSLCCQLRGNDSADSAVSTDSSMDESSETSSAKDVPAGSLRTALTELKSLILSVLDTCESASSRKSEDDGLEEQIKRTSEDSRALRELLQGEQLRMKQTFNELQQLHEQVKLLSVEMTALKKERDHLLMQTQNTETHEQLLKAIRDRDEAIAKKNAMEMELAKCRVDLMSLNTQLLDAIQQKLNLSQQLEAWQDDMHRVIDQQLMDKHQKEWNQSVYSFSTGHQVKHCSKVTTERPGEEPIGTEGRRLFSFLKKAKWTRTSKD
ncbi:BICD family-like cargo adapter 1 isoform X1 [Spea bombifrons]|uniref:BICD family-like cargo adapter 1 isoform X1 n=1 Tax=Spea bombifrons TaxID=233779 RepID=UPI00234B3E73|nr:BICD family-like cargo adapter 1 isoform X1 [Spea bombifrons]